MRRSEGELPEEMSGVTVAALSPNAQFVAALTDERAGEITLWDVLRGERLMTLELGIACTSLAFSPDGACVFAGMPDGRVTGMRLFPE